MKTDRELLELAARTIGVEGVFDENTGDIWRGTGSISWNPLKYDGDALRLAVGLNLSVCFTLGAANAPWGTAMVGYSPWEKSAPIAAERYANTSEKLAATRRAITRAAAQMQLNKEQNT